MRALSMPRRLAALLATALLVAAPAAVLAKTFVLPHVLEKSGSTRGTPFTFDTTMFFTYSEGLAGPGGGGGGGGALVDLHLYTDAGQPMRSLSGQTVCAPCQFTLSPAAPRAEASLEDLALARGGLPSGGLSGFAVAVSSGADPDSVRMHGITTASGSSPGLRQTRTLEPWDPNLPPLATRVLPHVFETSGKTSQFPFCADTRLDLVYAGGLPGVTGGTGDATVQLHLYDSAGRMVRSATGTPVCNPCAATVNAATRKRTLVLEDLITAAGGFTNTVIEGVARLEVGGSQPQHLALAASVLQSGSATGRLETVSLDLEPPGAGDTRETYVIPHVFEQKGRLRADGSADQDTVLHLVNPTALDNPAQVDSFFDVFFEDSFGLPLRSATGMPVCDPCTVALGGTSPAVAFRVQDAADAAGGLPRRLNEITARLEARGPDAGALCFSSWDTTTRERRFNQSRHVTGMPAPAGVFTNRVHTLLLPYLEMDAGLATERAFNRDTVLVLHWSPPPPGETSLAASLNLHLFDPAGLPLQSATGGEVCNPCTATLDADTPSRMISLDDLVVSSGGFPQPVVAGFGVIVIGGDADAVNVQGFIVNSHTSPLDVSVFGFEPEPIREATRETPPVGVLVTDPAGLGVPGVRVTVRDAGGVRAEATTDEQGELTLAPPVSGPLHVSAQRTGMQVNPPFFDIPYPSSTNLVFTAFPVAPRTQDLSASLTLGGADRPVPPGQILTVDAAVARGVGDAFDNTVAELRLPAGFQVASFTNNAGTATHDPVTQRILLSLDFSSEFTNTLRVTGTVLAEPPANRLMSFRGSEDSTPGLFPLRRHGRGDGDEHHDRLYRPPGLRLGGVDEECDTHGPPLGWTSCREPGFSPAGGLARVNDAHRLGADGLAHTLESPLPVERPHITRWRDQDNDTFGALYLAFTQPTLTPLPSPAMLACVPDLDADGYGDYSLAQNIPFGAGQTVADSLVGDMNADGLPDVVVLLAAAAGQPGEARVYPATGTGQSPFLGNPVTLATPANPTCLARCDLNQDGRADLVVASSNNLRVFTSRADGSGAYDTANVAVTGVPVQLHPARSNLAPGGQAADLDTDIFAQIGNRLQVFENTSGTATPLASAGTLLLDEVPPAQGVCVDGYPDYRDDDNDGARMTCYIDPVNNLLKGVRTLPAGGYGPPEVIATLRPGATRVFSLDGGWDAREPMEPSFSTRLLCFHDTDDDDDRNFSLRRLVVVEPGSLLFLCGPEEWEGCDDGDIYQRSPSHRLLCGKTAHLRVATGDICGDGIPDLMMLGETGVLNFSLHAGGDLPDPTPENNSAAARVRRSEGDASPPTVSLVTAPNGGPVPEGQAVAIQVRAIDDVAVVRADLLLQRPGSPDTIIHVLGREPLAHTFQVPVGLGGQNFRIGARVFDADGNTGFAQSSAFNVVPAGDDPPVVALVVPGNLSGMLDAPVFRVVAEELAAPPISRPGSAPGIAAYQVFRLADPVGSFTNGVDVATHPDAVRWSTAAQGADALTLVDSLGGVDETALYTLRPVYEDGTLGEYSPIARAVHRLVLHSPAITPGDGLGFRFPTAPGEVYTLQSADLPGAPFADLPRSWTGDGSDVQAEEPLAAPQERRVFKIKRTAAAD